MDDSSCDAQPLRPPVGIKPETRGEESTTRQGARAHGTEKHPSNLIRVIPALGTGQLVFAERVKPRNEEKDVGFFTAGPDAIATVEKATILGPRS